MELISHKQNSPGVDSGMVRMWAHLMENQCGVDTRIGRACVKRTLGHLWNGLSRNTHVASCQWNLGQ